jgi:hypothetical protein
MMGLSGGVAGRTYGTCRWSTAKSALFAGNGPAMT